MYMGPEYSGELAGFNPLKAIGRALGSTGRALVAAIPGVGPAASAVLEAGAHMPAKGQPSNAIATATPGGATAGAIAQPASVTPASAPMDLTALLTALVNKPQQTTQPIYTALPSPTPQTQPASGMPGWLLPAAIGGLALVVLMGKK